MHKWNLSLVVNQKRFCWMTDLKWSYKCHHCLPLSHDLCLYCYKVKQFRLNKCHMIIYVYITLGLVYAHSYRNEQYFQPLLPCYSYYVFANSISPWLRLTSSFHLAAGLYTARTKLFNLTQSTGQTWGSSFPVSNTVCYCNITAHIPDLFSWCGHRHKGKHQCKRLLLWIFPEYQYDLNDIFFIVSKNQSVTHLFRNVAVILN